MKLSEHFSESEFECKCGCGGKKVDTVLIHKLETLRELLENKPIIVSSGYRCSKHSVSVGGSSGDAHTKGIAADICCQGYTSEDIAEAAEKCGFTGIGIIDNNYCHVDVRNIENYVNSHWFGDERTGNNNIKTFIRSGSNVKSFSFDIDDLHYKITFEVVKK